MSTFLMAVEVGMSKYKKMDKKISDLYLQWCNDNLKGTMNEWFFNRDYTLDDILIEKELIGMYISNKFLKWCIDNDLLED